MALRLGRVRESLVGNFGDSLEICDFDEDEDRTLSCLKKF